jgi:RND family efflux transporter MFP subunit
MGVVFVALAVIAGAVGCKGAPKAPPPPPQEVQVITVAPTNVPIFQEWIGSLDGATNAEIRAQVTGYLMSQDYKEGGRVQRGQVLFQVDPRLFVAALDQAKAQLTAAQAQAEKTKQDVDRYTPLAKTQAISEEELADAVQAKLGAQASVVAAEASVQSAQLNLDFTRVTSLIDGIAGTAQAQIGNLVGPGTGVLTTVSTLDPIRVYFSISEQTYLAFCNTYTNTDERGNRSGLALQLILSDGSTYSSPGKWFFTSRQVDVNTGTLQVAGLFPNPNYILRPGGYAQVRAKVETRENTIMLPQRAVTELQGSYQVAVVTNSNNTNMVHIQTVQVGAQIGNNWIIDKGVSVGDQVVVEGTQKVREGAVVAPKPYQSAGAAP